MPDITVECHACSRNRTAGNTYTVYNENQNDVEVCADRRVCRMNCARCNNVYSSRIDYYVVNEQTTCADCIRRDGNCGDSCYNCRTVLSPSNPPTIVTVSDNGTWCGECSESLFFTSCCGAAFDSAESSMRREIYGLGVRCINCSSRVRDSWFCDCTPSLGIRIDHRCPSCNRNSTGVMARCSCGRGSEDNPIHLYSCIATLVFHGTSEKNLFFGIELETQVPGNKIINAAIFAMEKLQIPEIAELKEDGSIGGGFEIVTQPTTYEHYRNSSDVFFETVEYLRGHFQARSWDPGSCGIHIHISRNGFTDSYHMHRFIAFIYRNTEMMMKFSGRKSTYAKFDDAWGMDEYEQPYFTVASKLKIGGEKYAAVNVQHRDTLELRFFRGTLRKEGILSAIGLAHAMVEYTRDINMELLEPIDGQDRIEFDWSWESFDTYVRQNPEIYPELIERLPKIREVSLKSIEHLKIEA